MNKLFFKSFLVHDFSSKSDNTGLPNFYREAAIFSKRELKSSISTIEDIKSPKYLEITINILKRFINSQFLYSIFNYRKFNSFIYLTIGGLITIFLLRILGLNKKCFLVLYDIPFIKYYDFEKNKFIFKFTKNHLNFIIFKILLNHNINFVFLNSQQLKIFRQIYNRDKNSDFSFIYGVDFLFYDRFLTNLEFKKSISGFDLNNRYLLFVGSAYRNKKLFTKISKDTYFENNNIKLVTTSFAPNKDYSFLNLSDKIYNFYNLSSNDYLGLILSSSLILISSERTNTMAGLTSFLECYALRKKIFLTPNIYNKEYMNIMKSSNINLIEDNKIIEELKLYFANNDNLFDYDQINNYSLGIESCTINLIREFSKFHY